MIWLHAHPLPPLPSISSTDDTLEDWERETTCCRWGRGWGKGAAHKKAWPSIAHSILYGVGYLAVQQQKQVNGDYPGYLILPGLYNISHKFRQILNVKEKTLQWRSMKVHKKSLYRCACIQCAYTYSLFRVMGFLNTLSLLYTLHF